MRFHYSKFFALAAVALTSCAVSSIKAAVTATDPQLASMDRSMEPIQSSANTQRRLRAAGIHHYQLGTFQEPFHLDPKQFQWIQRYVLKSAALSRIFRAFGIHPTVQVTLSELNDLAMKINAMTLTNAAAKLKEALPTIDDQLKVFVFLRHQKELPGATEITRAMLHQNPELDAAVIKYASMKSKLNSPIVPHSFGSSIPIAGTA